MRRLSLAAAPAAIVAGATGARPVILVDGGSGSGKTSLALAVAAAWRASRHEDLQVVSLDDVYPGWYGLAAASAVVRGILAPEAAGYRRWNWETSEPADWVAVDPDRPILIEGCGSLTRESAPLATFRVWLDADESVRKVRALARDQGGFDSYWNAWAAQERIHWATNDPASLADVAVTTG